MSTKPSVLGAPDFIPVPKRPAVSHSQDRIADALQAIAEQQRIANLLAFLPLEFEVENGSIGNTDALKHSIRDEVFNALGGDTFGKRGVAS